jgi:hypothetical protein
MNVKFSGRSSLALVPTHALPEARIMLGSCFEREAKSTLAAAVVVAHQEIGVEDSKTGSGKRVMKM